MNHTFIAIWVFAIGAPVIVFLLGLRMFASEKWKGVPAVIFTTISAVGAVALATLTFRQELIRIGPESDYAYLVQVGYSPTEAFFSIKATNNIPYIYIAGRIIQESFYRKPKQKFPDVRQGLQIDFLYPLEIGDWTMDVDAPGEYGAILQHLVIESNDRGIPTVISSIVTRKGDGKPVMCQTPATRLLVPSCQLNAGG